MAQVNISCIKSLPEICRLGIARVGIRTLLLVLFTYVMQHKLNIALIENALKIIEQDDFHIVVQAECYVHAVELEGNYIFEDNYFIMLPDEQRNITFEPVGAVPNGGVTLKSYTLC